MFNIDPLQIRVRLSDAHKQNRRFCRPSHWQCGADFVVDGVDFGEEEGVDGFGGVVEEGGIEFGELGEGVMAYKASPTKLPDQDGSNWSV